MLEYKVSPTQNHLARAQLAKMAPVMALVFVPAMVMVMVIPMVKGVEVPDRNIYLAVSLPCL